MKKITNKLKAIRFKKNMKKYESMERLLKLQGVKHITYTSEGVPVPDFRQMIADAITIKIYEIEQEKKKKELLKEADEKEKLYDNIAMYGIKKASHVVHDENGREVETAAMRYDGKVYFVIFDEGIAYRFIEV